MVQSVFRYLEGFGVHALFRHALFRQALFRHALFRHLDQSRQLKESGQLAH